ncbi:hypothetical protein R3P38DRAFT_3207680 [Favolaschia claudopus]|uniref:Nephrocystin 3-like N-terminal domain-containing protein n=1 Tax=Favolaschia claudopus TaxID=2862362 RepID=A0AAW0AKJ0_9AGAR
MASQQPTYSHKPSFASDSQAVSHDDVWMSFDHDILDSSASARSTDISISDTDEQLAPNLMSRRWEPSAQQSQGFPGFPTGFYTPQSISAPQFQSIPYNARSLMSPMHYAPDPPASVIPYQQQFDGLPLGSAFPDYSAWMLSEHLTTSQSPSVGSHQQSYIPTVADDFHGSSGSSMPSGYASYPSTSGITHPQFHGPSLPNVFQPSVYYPSDWTASGIAHEQFLPPLAIGSDTQVISQDDGPSMPSSHYPSDLSASLISQQRFSQAANLSVAQNMQHNSNVFFITGGTGGNGGQSGEGVGGQGGAGEGPIFNNYYDSSPEQDREAALRELLKSTVPDASYDSAERYTYPLCHPDTRTKYLASLRSWSHKDTCNTLWMHGPAGTGKSSIARSFCQELATDGRLGANFFFKRGDPSRGSARGLFPTLAYQLAVQSAKFATAVATVIQKDPSVASKRLAIQFQRLIINPWNMAAPSDAVVIVIDGLDECQSEDDQQEILHCILKTSVSLKFLVVSRQEPQIEAKYLIEEFERIRATHKTMHQFPAPWPGYRVIDHLVLQSSGHFIYASTVIRFVDDPDAWPVKQLESIMKHLPNSGSLGSPFAALDSLYIQILRAVPCLYRPALLQILWIIAYQALRFSMRTLVQFLEMEEVEILLVLRRLNSILVVNVTSTTFVELHHSSFYDFLENPRRAEEFAFNADGRSCLALKVLKWTSLLHQPRLTAFQELSRYVVP